MKLSQNTPAQSFTVFNPRWHDRVALLAKYKVGSHNVITFPKAKSLAGKWYISGEHIRQFGTMMLKTKSGSQMECYEVPLDALEPLEWA